MNKKELTLEIAKNAKLTIADSEKALNGLIKIVSEELAKGGKVQLVGFGTYEVRRCSERTARNPQTGVPQLIPAKNVPVFKAGKGLKEQVNK